MTNLHESDIENLTIELLQKQGYAYLSPEEQEAERENLSDVVLRGRLKAAIDKLNPNIPEDAKAQALREVLNLTGFDPIESNEVFHQMLTDGVGVEYQKGGDTVGDKVWLIDFENPSNNDFIVANQFTVTENDVTKRPDVVLLVNGLPLVVIELKNAADEKATVKKAYTQLQNYKKAIPSLFYYNAVLVASDGIDAKVGSLTARWTRFMAWKKTDGANKDKGTAPEVQIETLIEGMLRPEVLLDLVSNFTVFEKTKKEELDTGLMIIDTVKKIAAYHQYYAVNKAIEATKKASREHGNRKAGVVWHTQGSGKSLSMVFYAGKLIVDPKMGNPTIVVITDRNDLDDQLFDTFASSKNLLRQEPVQATNRIHLKKLLKTAGGGIVFTTIQKFSPEDLVENFELLSERKNIIVVADEAHRSQYGFSARTLLKDGKAVTKYGFAKYLRDALPNASFVGFTGTPIEKEDASTPAVFGNYIDVYDIQQAVKDGATVPIYYESRLAKVHMKKDQAEKLDAEVERVAEGDAGQTDQESSAAEKAKAKWTQLEAIVGHKERLKIVAADIVHHFEARQEAFEGKGMIVAMSRRIAAELYADIVKVRPEWHDEDKRRGAIKVVMTSSSSDPESWQIHNTTKQERKALGERLKDPRDPLKLVIVRDMWLTGFDAPSLHTMYIDKQMQGHNLMQAIARVNRVYKDKPGGLIVDYIGIASDLKKALATYTQSGGKGTPALDQSEAIAAMLEKYDVVAGMFEAFDFKRYLTTDTRGKMTTILEAQEHILGLENGKSRFTKEVGLLSKAFALSVPSLKALNLKEEIGFFQAVKARLTKFEPSGGGKSDAEIETAIRQIVDEAVSVDGVVDIFDAAGIKKPDISILSDDFLAEVQDMQHQNLAIELLKKILADELRTRGKKNFIQSKKISDMLDAAIKKYQNNLLTAAQVIEELIKVAKEIKAADERGDNLGLSEDEIAFYDALNINDSAKEVLGDDTLRELARLLVEKVKANTSIDWTIKESVQAKLRVIVRRLLRQYGYPPDKQKLATDGILKQAELFAEDWSEKNE